jgi:uncharacterized membrane protein
MDMENKVHSRGSADRRLETLLGNVLKTGVIVSAVVVLIGAVVYLSRHGMDRADFRVFKGEPANLRSVAGIVGDALAESGQGIIQLGLLLLIATPVLRVLLSLAGFLRQGDKTYIIVTVFVLAVLIYSLAGRHPP